MGKSGLESGPGECNQWKAKGRSRGDNCSFRHDDNKSGKQAQTSAHSSEPRTEKDGEKSSKRKSPRGRSPSGKLTLKTCRDNLKGECTRTPRNFWHPPACQHHKKTSGCKFGNVLSCASRLKVNPAKSRKRAAITVLPY